MKNEGVITTIIEQQTRRIPSLAFLGAAVGVFAASGLLAASGRRNLASFVGTWVPTILVLGVYNKIAKTFSAPLSEAERLRHGDHRIFKPNDYATRQPTIQ